MRKIILQLFIVFAVVGSVFAQVPEKMSYQAVVRDNANELVANTAVGIQVSILQGSSTGAAVYVETQNPTTNINGLVSIEIGAGNVVSGDFSTIDWASGPYFIKTETDPAGGSDYSITGTSELLSVPYALHAKTADAILGTINETDPEFNASVAKGITASDTAKWNNKLSTVSESDPVFGASVAGGITSADTAKWNNKIIPTISESDPVFEASVAGGITAADTSKWNSKLGNYTETDPVYLDAPAALITDAGSGRVMTFDERTKLKYLEFGAERNVQSDWSVSDTTLDSYIQNKPDLFTNADEIDPIYSASVASGITSTDTTYWNNKLDSYTETDPVYGASVASGITSADTTYWNNKLDSYTETDPVYGASVASGITATDTTNWNNKLDSETDPVYTASQASNITASDISNLGNLSGTNTGDQDLSTLATKVALGDSIAQVRSEIPAAADGSETKVTAGTNVTVTGTGTAASPYVVNAIAIATQADRDTMTVYEGLTVYNTTTHLPNYYNGTEWMNYDGTSAKTPAVGDSYQGGIIAYIFVSGDAGYVAGETHGLIAASSDQSTGIVWYNGGYTFYGVTATAIGTGSTNTSTIVSSQGAGSYAAQLCNDLVLGGYSDWYLPSKDELSKLYLNRVAIGGFSGGYYWSSTEYDAYNAAIQNFGSGTQYVFYKNTSAYVRAIRTF